MIDLGRLDLQSMTDAELRKVSRIMKQNGEQLLKFNDKMAEEQTRRKNGRN